MADNSRVAGNSSFANGQHQGMRQGISCAAEGSSLRNRDKWRGGFKVEKYASEGEEMNTALGCLLDQYAGCLRREFSTVSKNS